MGNEYFKPNNGNEYVVATLNIENKSDKDISYNPLDFQIQNEDGQITHNTFGPSDDNDLSSGNLTPNGKVSGTITFETKKSKTYKVIYTPEFWNDKRLLSTLNNSKTCKENFASFLIAFLPPKYDRIPVQQKMQGTITSNVMPV